MACSIRLFICSVLRLAKISAITVEWARGLGATRAAAAAQYEYNVDDHVH